MKHGAKNRSNTRKFLNSKEQRRQLLHSIISIGRSQQFSPDMPPKTTSNKLRFEVLTAN